MQVQVVDYRANDAAEKFAAALKEIGFAVISHHPVNQQLINQAYAQWGEFFHSPLEQKNEFEFQKSTHDGYVSPNLSETAKGYSQKDLKEFYHFFMHGRCPAQLRPVTEQLFNELFGLAKTLLSWVEKSTPENIRSKWQVPLSQTIENSPHSLLRFIHYPPLKGDEAAGAVRAAPHEDINLLTLLPAATAKGLEVKNSKGEWLEVPCDPNWIIVNSGDMLQECTDAFYRATTHRVVNPTDPALNRSRLSIPLFLHARDEVKLSERHTAQSYRRERFLELGLLDEEDDH